MAIQRGAFEGMRELALFAGAGGGILGGYLLGWRTICAVEWEPYPSSVLCARQNDGILPPFPIWDDVRTFDGRPWRGRVDVVSGGFPCQDISVAGSGAGLDGERSGLWSQFARIIGEVRPRFAYIENSPRLVVLGLDRVLCDLAALGYDAEWGVLSAADLGAPHQRERLWIVAHANSQRDAVRWDCPANAQTVAGGELHAGGSKRDCGQGRAEVAGESSGADTDAMCERQPQPRNSANASDCQANRNRQTGDAFDDFRWPDEPDIPRVANGVAYRMDRVKAVGNGQVSVVAAAAFAELCRRGGWS